MRLGLWAGLLVLAGWLGLPDGVVLQAQTSADLFNDQTLHDLHLLINSRDLAELRARFQENIFFPADLVWRTQRVRNVGIRSRGLGSRNKDKLGLLIDVDRYTTGQRFLGLSSLVLDNGWQDKSLIREFLAMAMYRRLVEAAPRESFCKLYINGVYQGLYTIVEDINPEFVARTTGDTGGYLYEYRWHRELYTEDLGDDLAAYAEIFEARTHEKESPSALYGPIRELFREINAPFDAVWQQRVDARIDLKQFMAQAAVQGCLTSNDGLLGNFGINNFFLYRFRDSIRHRLFAWDEDQAFQFQDISVLRQGPQEVVLFQRAYAIPELKTHFLDVAERCGQTLIEDNWFASELERVVALITPAVFADTNKQFSNVDFEGDIEFLRGFAAIRPPSLLEEVRTRRQ